MFPVWPALFLIFKMLNKRSDWIICVRPKHLMRKKRDIKNSPPGRITKEKKISASFPAPTSQASIATSSKPNSESRNTRPKVPTSPKISRTQKPNAFPVVGIGASAGGLEAFTELLKQLPDDTGMAFILVQHLAPEHDSILPQILAKITKMPVHEAKDKVTVEPNQVYVIPPNASMQIDQGTLRISPREKTKGRLRSIDFFLHSLAADQGALAIGVILSGTDFDGTAGIEMIKHEGGITFAQDERSAKFDSMPRSAAATGAVDFVLPPAKIAQELTRLSQSIPSFPGGELAVETAPIDEPHFKKMLEAIRSHKKVDFSYYKQNTIRRRIARRMVINKVENAEDYAQFLQKNPQEVNDLYDDVLINVTSFFRDPAMFDVLKERVFPKLIANRPADEPVRIWVAGCSMGQEAYSLAMAYLECTAAAGSQIPLQIFATDLNETMLERARQGRYTPSQMHGISPERIRRFFVKEDGTYNICKPIREMCIFALHDIITDSPFSRMDLVSCRNLLIYFDSPLQKKVMPVFHYALKPEGYLVLGSSETVGDFHNSSRPKAKRIKFTERKRLSTGQGWICPVCASALPKFPPKLELQKPSPPGPTRAKRSIASCSKNTRRPVWW